jgi:hypothetical protein
VRVPSLSGYPSFSRTSSINMSEISTPRSFTSHVSYCRGMTLTFGSWGRALLAGEAGTCNTVLASLGTAAGSPAGRVLSRDVRRPCGCACCAGATGCGVTRTSGSGGSVTTGAAEEGPRGVGAIADAVRGAESDSAWALLVSSSLLLVLVLVRVSEGAR